MGGEDLLGRISIIIIIDHSIKVYIERKEEYARNFTRPLLTAGDATRQRGGVALLVGPRRPVHYPPPLVQNGGLLRRHWNRQRGERKFSSGGWRGSMENVKE